MTDLPKKTVQLGDKTYLIQKLSAWDQLEIAELFQIESFAAVAQCLKKRENVALLLQRVSIKREDGGEIPLETPDLINNHVAGAKECFTLAGYVLDYNFDFFGTGGSQSFMDFLLQRCEQLLIPTVTRLLEQFLVAVNQASPNLNESASKKP